MREKPDYKIYTTNNCQYAENIICIHITIKLRIFSEILKGHVGGVDAEDTALSFNIVLFFWE